jgi:hypothetical protein
MVSAFRCDPVAGFDISRDGGPATIAPRVTRAAAVAAGRATMSPPGSPPPPQRTRPTHPAAPNWFEVSTTRRSRPVAAIHIR